MNKKNMAIIIFSFIFLFQAFNPVILAMNFKDLQHISDINYNFDDEPIDYDIGFVADIMEYLEMELQYEINIPSDSKFFEVFSELEPIYTDTQEIRELSWNDLKVNYLMSSVYGKVLIDRPINYSINEFELEIYLQFLWLLENKELTNEQEKAIYRGINYIISNEYKIAKTAINDARNLVKYHPTEESKIKLIQSEVVLEEALRQIKEGNTYPALINLQLANLKAHEVLQMYGQEYSKEHLKVDSDGDGLIDLAENYFNTDPYHMDTDRDNLNDLYEIETTETDPVIQDTDENGISDSEEDFDQDGLSNLEEFNHGTDPYSEDTDYDRLSDFVEVNTYHTLPTVYDTDKDSIEDGREIELGLNPLVIDTDGDGILDNEEKFSQEIYIDEDEHTFFEEVGVIPRVQIYGTAIEPYSVYINDASERWNRIQSNAGIIGHEVRIETSEEFEKATISFKYNEEALNGAKPENLRIIWHDEQNDKYVVMPNTDVDSENKIVSVTTDQLFGVYFLADKKKLDEGFSIRHTYLLRMVAEILNR